MGKGRLARVVALSAIRRIRISSFGTFQGDRETAADWQESFLRAGNREQRRAIDLGNIHGAATSRRPFNGDVVAVHATHIKIAFQRIGLNCFSSTRARLAKRPEWTSRTSRPASPRRYIRMPALMLAMLSVQDAGMMGLISLKSAGTKRHWAISRQR